jgi:hypothetical protein
MGEKNNNIFFKGTRKSNCAADRVLIILGRRIFSFLDVPHHEEKWEAHAVQR